MPLLSFVTSYQGRIWQLWWCIKGAPSLHVAGGAVRRVRAQRGKAVEEKKRTKNGGERDGAGTRPNGCRKSHWRGMNIWEFGSMEW